MRYRRKPVEVSAEIYRPGPDIFEKLYEKV